MKILIVEDHAMSARMLERAFQRAGDTVAIAREGADALEHMQRDAFDALLVAWMIAEADGIELIRRVSRTVSPGPAIPFIAALGAPERRGCALQAGADDYIVKPFETAELLGRLHTRMGRRGRVLRQTGGAHAAAASPSGPPAARRRRGR